MVKHGNQPCPDIAQVTVELQRDAQTIIQDYYFFKTGGWAAGNMETLALTAGGSAVANFQDSFCADTTFIRAVATDLTSLAAERAVYQIPATPPGLAAGTSSAANVAWSVQKQTGNRGKGKQGRIMWGPIPEGDITGNLISDVYANAVVTALGVFVAECAAVCGGSVHVIVSRWDNKVWRTNGIPVPVHGFGYTNLVADSQKLRLPQHKKRKITAP